MTANRPLHAFYVTVLSLALVGQSTAAYQWVSLPTFIPVLGELAVIAGFVAVLELGAVVLLREVVARRQKGDPAHGPLIASMAVVALAAAITFAGHWGNELPARISAIAFAAVTIGGYVVFMITADLEQRPEHLRSRRVAAAVAEYVMSLPGMSQHEKNVLLATTNTEKIASQITRGLDNDRIASMLSAAINPAGWDVPANPDRPRKTSPVKNRPSPTVPPVRPAVSPPPVAAVPEPADGPSQRPQFKDLPPEDKQTVTAEICAALAAMADPEQPSPFPSQRQLAAYYNASKSEVNRIANREPTGPIERVNGSEPAHA